MNRERIRKYLIAGLAGSVMTGAGDFMIGFGEETARGSSIAEQMLAGAANLSDIQLITGGLLGMVGIFIEGIAFFAIEWLMRKKAPRYAKIYRMCIFGYIWLAPVGCHLNVGLMNLAYKYLLQADPSAAPQLAERMFYGFALPVYVLLVLFWLPMIVIQFLAFSKGLTPYPRSAKWFNLIVGAIPALVISGIIGFHTALGAGIGTMFLSCGNAWTFAGLLCTLPDQKKMEERELLEI